MLLILRLSSHLLTLLEGEVSEYYLHTFNKTIAMAVALTIAAVVLIVGVPGVIAVIYRCFFKKKKEVLPTLNDVPDHKDPPTEPKDTGSYDGSPHFPDVIPETGGSKKTQLVERINGGHRSKLPLSSVSRNGREGVDCLTSNSSNKHLKFFLDPIPDDESTKIRTRIPVKTIQQDLPGVATNKK